MEIIEAERLRWSLSDSKLLAGLPEATIRELERACQWFRCGPDEVILSAEESLEGIYFIAEGTVRIFRRLEGKREIEFAQFGPGDAFGELSAIDGQGRSADAVTVGEAVVAVCPRQVFRDMLVAHPMLALRLLEKLAGIIRKSDRRIANLAAMTGPQRVYAELLRLATPNADRPGTYIIDPAPYHRDIAARADTTTDVVVRAFSQLMKANLMQRQGASLILNDCERISVMVRTVDEEA